MSRARSKDKQNQTLPTELLIQHSLNKRNSVRLRVSVAIYDNYDQYPKYSPIQDSVVYLEVNNPGLVWRVVGTVTQALKRLDVEMEGEREQEDRRERPEWLQILPGSGAGRPKGSTAENIRRSKADNAGQPTDTTDEGPPVGFV